MRRKILRSVTIALIILAMPITVSPHEGAEGVVKTRMASMKVMASSMKSLSLVARGKVQIDATEIKSHIVKIRKESGERLLQLFPKGSDVNPSEANPKIWDEWNEFAKLAEELSQRAELLESSISIADPHLSFVRAFKKLSAICSNCHKRFRIKK